MSVAATLPPPLRLPHSIATVLMMEWLMAHFPGRRAVTGTAIDVRPADNPTSDPEPDIVVLRTSIVELNRRPRPEDILLLVEISDSTLAFDLSVKAKLYARAGNGEYWVADLNGRRIVTHRDPLPDIGSYRPVKSYSALDRIAPLAAPQAEIAVAELLPRQS
jgi:Uma2 family endonuclease